MPSWSRVVEAVERAAARPSRTLKDTEAMAADPDDEGDGGGRAGGAQEAAAGARARVKRSLLPKDAADERTAILEIRAGTGGDEAALFAGDLFRMYQRYADDAAAGRSS